MGTKVTFDGVNKIVQVTQAPVFDGVDWVIDIDFKIDIYSDGKEDWLTTPELRKRYFPIRPVGGDDLPGSKKLGSTFFLASDWKMRPHSADHVLRINGNVYSEDGTSPFTSALGSYSITIINTVSSLVDSTVQQLAELQYISYQNAVWLDETSDNSGTAYPVGTREYPANNWFDSISIANERGFAEIGLLSSSTIDSGANIEGFEIFGQSHVNTSLHILDSVLAQEATFRSLNVTGVLDGGSEITDCMVGDITNFNGHIHNSSLYGLITLGGGSDALFSDCAVVDLNNFPTVDMGGTGQNLIMSEWTGRIAIRNMTGLTNKIAIGINAGLITLENTITGGSVELNGVGAVMDNSTGTTDVNHINLVKGKQLNEIYTITTGSAYAGQVYLDVDSIYTGTEIPVGLVSDPVNNLTDAIAILTLNGGNSIYLSGSLVLDQDVSNYDFHAWISSSIDMNNQACLGAQFYGINITGIQHDSASFFSCKIKSIVGILGQYNECGFQDNNTNYLASGQTILNNNRSSVAGNNSPTFDLSAGNIDLSVRAYSGGIKLLNSTDPTNIGTIEFIAGRLNLDSTNTLGFISARGVFSRNDTSGVGFIVDYSGANIQVSEIWDETLSEHLLTGTTGLATANSQFNETVVIDVNGEAGTTFPLGTMNHPVNNLADAKIIAAVYGFIKLTMNSALTITSGQSISGYIITSDNHSLLTLDLGAITQYTFFSKLVIRGYLNGYTVIDNCSISRGPLYDFYGVMDRVIFNDNISVSSDSANNAIFLDCYTGNVSTPPVIDCNGDGAKISFRGLTGAALFINKTGSTQPIFLDIRSGRIGFDSTITAGNITIRGIGYIYQDDSTNVIFDTDGFISRSNISRAVWSENVDTYDEIDSMGRLLNDTSYTDKWIYVDTELVLNGDGRSHSPFNNFPDAVDFAETVGWRKLMLLSDATIDRTLKNFLIEGIGSLPTIDINGQNVDRTEFSKVKLTGTQVGTVTAREVLLLNLIGVNGVYKDSGIIGNIILADDAIVTIAAASSVVTSTTSAPNIINMGNGIAGSVLSLRKYSGGIELTNVNNVNRVATCEFAGGRLIINGTNTNGIIRVAGLPDTAVFDSSAGTLVNIDGVFPGAQTITNTVWNADLENYLTANTTASAIKNLQILIEERRESHTGTGDMYYVDPFNGTSFASGADGSFNNPLASIQDCHDNLVEDNHHDIITILAGNPNGITELDEQVTLTKNYMFIRGPGRDLFWKSTSIGDVITVNGDGIELKSFQMETHNVGVGDAIKVSGAHFTRIENVWIGRTQGHGISINNSSTILVLKSSLQYCGTSGAGHGISIDPAGGTTEGVLISESYFSDIQGSGIIIKSDSVRHVIIQSNKFHHCTDYGINIQADTLNTFVTLNVLGGNTLGDIEDNGTETVSINNEQWSTVDAIWDEPVDDHQISGSFGHWVKKKLLTLANFIALK